MKRRTTLPELTKPLGAICACGRNVSVPDGDACVKAAAAAAAEVDQLTSSAFALGDLAAERLAAPEGSSR